MNIPKIGVARVDETPLAPLTSWAVARMLPHVPLWVMPNGVTLGGCAMAILAGAAFYLASFNRAWFWGAAIALLVYALADCLDGSLARARNLISAKGFFLDIFLDDISFIAIYLGIAFSDYAIFEIVALGAIIHLLSDVLVTMRIHLRDQHVIPSFGPTELCASLIGIAILTSYWKRSVLSLFGYKLGWFDLMFIVGGVVGAMQLIIDAYKLYSELDGIVAGKGAATEVINASVANGTDEKE